jgi:hypothetical protein
VSIGSSPTITLTWSYDAAGDPTPAGFRRSGMTHRGSIFNLVPPSPTHSVTTSSMSPRYQVISAPATTTHTRKRCSSPHTAQHNPERRPNRDLQRRNRFPCRPHSSLGLFIDGQNAAEVHQRDQALSGLECTAGRTSYLRAKCSTAESTPSLGRRDAGIGSPAPRPVLVLGLLFYGLGRTRYTSTSSRPRARTRVMRPCRAA